MTAVSQPTSKAVCAVVVAFYPDTGFEGRILNLLPQVGALVIVDNTPGGRGCAAWIGPTVTDGSTVEVIANRANVGVAAALNQGLERALHLGCRWILTLDQDSQCYSDIVQTLLEVCADCEPPPGVVGANYFDPQSGRLKVRPDAGGICLEQTTVITSGSLINAEMARAIGGFRDDYFIDQVDHEFCLRARAHGTRVVISRKPAMDHSVGGPGGAKVPCLGTLPNHPPLRKYYITRNTVVTVSEYWRREPEWCLRRIARLLLGLISIALLEEHRLAKLRAFGAGIADGIRRRMGQCRREWLTRGL